jgi:hypothetical protein
MAFVSIPKDLTKVKTRLILNLTRRQVICFGLAAAVGIPTYLVTHIAIGNSAAVFVMIGLMLPFFFFAMFERDGQPAEKILRNILRAKLWRGTRPYKTENLYKYLSTKGGDAIVSNYKTANGHSAQATQTGGKRKTIR